jgi:hypothetical protein
MRSWIYTLFLITFTSCFATKECSCGIPEKDHDYSQAVSHFIAAARHAGVFHFRGLTFPSNSRTPVIKYCDSPLFCEEGIIDLDKIEHHLKITYTVF